jgi:hypothetical protein
MQYTLYTYDFSWDEPMVEWSIQTAIPPTDKKKVQICAIRPGLPTKANKDYG